MTWRALIGAAAAFLCGFCLGSVLGWWDNDPPFPFAVQEGLPVWVWNDQTGLFDCVGDVCEDGETRTYEEMFEEWP